MFLPVLQVFLQPQTVFIGTHIESKCHGWLDLRVMDLLCICLMVRPQHVLFNRHPIEWNRCLRVVRVQEDHAVLLHACQVVSFLWSASDYSTVQLLHEEGANWLLVVFIYFLESQTS